MKKFAVLLYVLFSFAMIHAQDHLAFKGVPIDGTLAEFVACMEETGLTFVGEENGTALLHGDFAGFRKCSIRVTTLQSYDIVNHVTVSFEAQNNWKKLYRNYSSLKEMLTKKYGKCTECVEKFDSQYSPSNDGSRMTLLYLGKCNYYAIWEMENGIIKLDIVKGSTVLSNGMSRLQYWDKSNTELLQQKVLDDL